MSGPASRILETEMPLPRKLKTYLEVDTRQSARAREGLEDTVAAAASPKGDPYGPHRMAALCGYYESLLREALIVVEYLMETKK